MNSCLNVLNHTSAIASRVFFSTYFKYYLFGSFAVFWTGLSTLEKSYSSVIEKDVEPKIAFLAMVIGTSIASLGWPIIFPSYIIHRIYKITTGKALSNFHEDFEVSLKKLT